MQFGIPYMGSKAKHALWILRTLPKAKKLYDLFGGGFAISHAAILSKKYQTVHYNEIKADIVQLVKDAIEGKYNYKVFKPQWISREEFNQVKEKNAYARICWSFGNDQRTYLFGEEIEGQKRSLHNAVIFNIFDAFAINHLKRTSFKESESIYQRRMYVRRIAKERSTSELQRLQQLEQLERLQQLERLSCLSISSKDYKEVEIQEDSVIYCDPPYKGTNGYGVAFDSEAFYGWVKSHKCPIFFSEYNCPNGFTLVSQKKAVSILSSNSRHLKSEKLYANQAGAKLMGLKWHAE